MALDVRGLTPLLQVYDMPTSVRFYRDVLGFEVAATSPMLGEDRFHWALLRLGDAELMLNTAYEFDNDRPAEACNGPHFLDKIKPFLRWWAALKMKESQCHERVRVTRPA